MPVYFLTRHVPDAGSTPVASIFSSRLVPKSARHCLRFFGYTRFQSRVLEFWTMLEPSAKSKIKWLYKIEFLCYLYH